MKKRFEAIPVEHDNPEWGARTASTLWLMGKALRIATTPEHRPHALLHADYIACEYRITLNLGTFGPIPISLPFTVIAPPASVDALGYQGDLQRLIEDYKGRKGLFLMLNLREDAKSIPKNLAAVGKTLPTCVLENRFANFSDYLTSLRSSYRRRLKTAMKKGHPLQVRSMDCSYFNERHYDLYLQVLRHSDFPLETLSIGFFQNAGELGCKLEVLELSTLPLAFVLYRTEGDTLQFIFGGMDYLCRDCYDLYYNMLLHLIRIGISKKVRLIDLGQTAEQAKCRVGCRVEERYMAAFSGNPLLQALLSLAAPLLQNTAVPPPTHPFRQGKGATGAATPE